MARQRSQATKDDSDTGAKIEAILDALARHCQQRMAAGRYGTTTLEIVWEAGEIHFARMGGIESAKSVEEIKSLGAG